MIEQVPGAQPISCKIYPTSSEEPNKVDTFLKESLQSRRTRPLKSPMASPFFFVKKKDVKLRPVDKLNTSPNLMFNKSRTTSKSKKEKNGRQGSEPTQDCLNHW